MRLALEPRAERSAAVAIVSPLIAIAFTFATMAVLFMVTGKNPFAALWVDAYSLQEIAVKATPLVMIALGLSLCYLANVWNIGAEGQFLIGAVAGSWLAVKINGTGGCGRARRRALRPHSCDLQGEIRRKRNSHQPDAGLCGRPFSRLPRARPIARSQGIQFSDHAGFRSGRHGSCSHPR
jgi:hypothetical protein